MIPTTAQWQTSTCHSHTVSKNSQDYWILTYHNSKGISYEVARMISVSTVSCLAVPKACAHAFTHMLDGGGPNVWGPYNRDT